MLINRFRNFICFVLFFFSNNTYASLGVFDEDLELSRKTPLIAGIREITEDIKKGNKAAITLCTIPLSNPIFSYDHVSLVFEIKHPAKNEINLFSVHFGGDGDSSDTEKGRPTIDNSSDTLRKVFRGKKTTILGTEDSIDPLYSRKVSFVIEHNRAIESLIKIENDHDLKYTLTGGQSFLSKKDTYNCCTYIDKCLADAGIETGFNQSFSFKTASALVDRCLSYNIKENQYRTIHKDDHSILEIPEYKDSAEVLFKKGLDFKEQRNYDESIKCFLESAKKGHPVSQYFTGLFYYNNDQLRSDYTSILEYYKKYPNFLNDKTNDFNDLMLKYQDFSSCTYFKKVITKRDEEQAFKWMERSANNGFSRAEGDLGYFYNNGIGVDQDNKKAVEWYKRAKNKGDAIANYNLRTIFNSSQNINYALFQISYPMLCGYYYH